MSGVTGRSGGARTGAGRKTLKTEREIKERLQGLLPDAFEAIQTNLRSLEGKKKSTHDAWKILDKFVPDRKSTDLSVEEKEPLVIKIIGGGFRPPKDNM